MTEKPKKHDVAVVQSKFRPNDLINMLCRNFQAPCTSQSQDIKKQMSCILSCCLRLESCRCKCKSKTIRNYDMSHVTQARLSPAHSTPKTMVDLHVVSVLQHLKRLFSMLKQKPLFLEHICRHQLDVGSYVHFCTRAI